MRNNYAPRGLYIYVSTPAGRCLCMCIIDFYPFNFSSIKVYMCYNINIRITRKQDIPKLLSARNSALEIAKVLTNKQRTITDKIIPTKKCFL